MLIKLCSTIIIWVCCMRSFVIAQSKPLINVLAPSTSSNSVTYNDCNLRLTNQNLLLKRLGNDSTQTFWTANDVITAYNNTISSPECGWSTSIQWDIHSASLVANLCDIAIKKLSRVWWDTAYPPAQKLWTWLSSSGTDANGIIPWAVRLQLISILWKQSSIIVADASPQKCGQVSTELWDIYWQLLGSIENIVSDCGTYVPYTPQWIDTVTKLLWSNQETPYVWWVQQWWVSIARALNRCQQKIQESYDHLFNAAQVISIKQGSEFANGVLAAYVANISQQNKTLSEKYAQATITIKDAKKQTPTVAVCEIKG